LNRIENRPVQNEIREKAMNRVWRVLAGAAAATALAAPIAMAQSDEQPKNPPRASDQENARPAATPRIPADAPGVRLAGLIRRDGVVLRNKGIASVQRIATGIFCITPAGGTGITPNNAIVQLTPEFFYSLFNEIKVQWATSGSGCGPNRIAVYTMADRNFTAHYTFSNAVSFSIIVP
jgi:hypothetical protein